MLTFRRELISLILCLRSNTENWYPFLLQPETESLKLRKPVQQSIIRCVLDSHCNRGCTQVYFGTDRA